MAAEPLITAAASQAAEELVKEADLGGREPEGKVGALLALVAASWSIFQVWYASPLPFIFGFGIFNDTEARSIHLAFAVFLAFIAFPAFKRSSRTVVPVGRLGARADRRVLRRLPVPVLQRARHAPGQTDDVRHRRRDSRASRSCWRPRAGRWASAC